MQMHWYRRERRKKAKKQRTKTARRALTSPFSQRCVRECRHVENRFRFSPRQYFEGGGDFC